MTQPLQHGWGHVTRSSPLRHGRKVGGPASLSAQVKAILLGTDGFALDPTDVTTMWQDTGTVTPVVSAADPVGHIRSKWGTTIRDLTQATAGSRPAWSGTSLTFDGTDDRIFLGSSNILQNAPAAFCCAKLQYDAYPGTQGYAVWVAASAAGNARFALRSDTGGTFFQQRRRANADASTFLNHGAGTVVASTPLVISSLVDYNTGPTENWKDGVSLGTNTLAGSGNSENVASAQFGLGSNNGPSFFMQGRIGRMVVLPFIPSAGQRATIEAWCGETAL